jgi:hypothetical protein
MVTSSAILPTNSFVVLVPVSAAADSRLVLIFSLGIATTALS